MTQQAYGTPPPPPKKSGLPTWAWIVLGCLLIAILGLGATCVGGYFLAKKATDKISAWEKDPSSFAMDAAEFALKNNPEVDLVSIDREAKTFTVRDKNTGKETTVSLEDIENGKFSVTSGGQEVNVDVDSAAQNGGSINVTGPDGTRLQIGGGGEIPEWVPAYPGATPQNLGQMTAGDQRSGNYSFTTGDSVKSVLDHYEPVLEAAGFTIELRSTSGDEGGLISARSGDRVVNLAAGRSGAETTVTVTFTEKVQ
ncbi:MAG: hypothetical protein SF066_12890 [Thermoanaerobaculia bacterium]|nr:hypothetical protein [Thermoanaerobaculia bacterium]